MKASPKRARSKGAQATKQQHQDSPIYQYWQEIESGREVVSKKVRRQYKKLVEDLNDKYSKWEYSPGHANHTIDFIEQYCCFANGKPFILELWQKAFVAASFGFVHKLDRTRRYTEVILIVGRKNGKTTLAAAIALYLLIADGETRPQIVSAATKRDQAKLVWKEAKSMIAKSPALRECTKTLVAEIRCLFNEGEFIPLSADSHKQDGLGPSGAIIDELHAIADPNMYHVIKDGMAARDQPLSVIITTNGSQRMGIFDDKYNMCKLIIQNYDSAKKSDYGERTLPVVYELDSKDEWRKRDCWKKANPGLGTIKKLDQLELKIKTALVDNVGVSNMLTKDFNIPATSETAYFDYDDIYNPATFDIAELKPRYGIMGADLSEIIDLTCATVIFMVPEDPHIYVQQKYWLPETELRKHEATDKVPYGLWVEQGYVDVCADNKINYHDVVRWFTSVYTDHDIYLTFGGYDRWSASYFIEEMHSNFGKSAFEGVAQGAQSFSSPLKNLKAEFQARRVIYNNNPVLKWCLTNTAVQTDNNNNIRPVKQKSAMRIDGLISLLNAYVVFERHREEYLNLI